MPIYVYQCSNPRCGQITEERRPVLGRNVTRVCDTCNWGHRKRQFAPTANIVIAEHFRHNQRDFLPPKGDAAWDKIQMGGDSQMHSRPSAGEQLVRELENA